MEVGEGDRTLARGDEAQAGGNLEEGDVEGICVPPEVDDCQKEKISADNFGSPPKSKAKYKRFSFSLRNHPVSLSLSRKLNHVAT